LHLSRAAAATTRSFKSGDSLIDSIAFGGKFGDYLSDFHVTECSQDEGDHQPILLADLRLRAALSQAQKRPELSAPAFLAGIYTIDSTTIFVSDVGQVSISGYVVISSVVSVAPEPSTLDLMITAVWMYRRLSATPPV
jgi:hypothetical protein